MLIAFIVAVSTPVGDAARVQPRDCSYDLEAMLVLDRNAFDQTMDRGWRPLAHRGCKLEAAELIREWRHRKRDHASILYWHEGQLRALLGQAEEAVALFKLTYDSPDEDANFGWNHYVDGTIAFLRRDRKRLATAIERLRGVPKPANASITLPDGMSWPPNLNVLLAFEGCWDKSYKETYGSQECSKSAS